MTGRHGQASSAVPDVGGRSAVARLEDIRSHQQSLLRDVRQNWQGWIGSIVFHGVLVVIFATITWTILSEKREYIIDVPRTVENNEISKESLEKLLLKSLMPKTEFERVPSTRAFEPKPSVGSMERDDVVGLPDWYGKGPYTDGRFGLGGKGGLYDDGGIGDLDPDLRKWGRKHPVDVVFVFDATGSMGGIILEVKTRIRTFMHVITTIVPEARVGLVAYRDLRKYDLDDYEWTVRYSKLTGGDDAGIKKVQRFLRETEAFGGGDIPEAVYEGVKTAIEKSGWRQGAKKVIIVFGDAPPRPENNGLAKMYDLCREWHQKTGGIVSCIDTTGNSKRMDEFRQMAEEGGGRSCFLNNEEDIVKQMMIYVFPEELSRPAGDVWSRMSRDVKDNIIEE